MRVLGQVIGVEANESLMVYGVNSEVMTVSVKIALENDAGLLTLWMPRNNAPTVGEEMTITVEREV